MRKFKDKCFVNLDWIIDRLNEENLKQIKKWGIQNRSAFEWMTYTVEELGELAEAISECEYRGGSTGKIISEAFQVATLTLKIAEMYLTQGVR